MPRFTRFALLAATLQPLASCWPAPPSTDAGAIILLLDLDGPESIAFPARASLVWRYAESPDHCRLLANGEETGLVVPTEGPEETIEAPVTVSPTEFTLECTKDGAVDSATHEVAVAPPSATLFVYEDGDPLESALAAANPGAQLRVRTSALSSVTDCILSSNASAGWTAVGEGNSDILLSLDGAGAALDQVTVSLSCNTLGSPTELVEVATQTLALPTYGSFTTSSALLDVEEDGSFAVQGQRLGFCVISAEDVPGTLVTPEDGISTLVEVPGIPIGTHLFTASCTGTGVGPELVSEPVSVTVIDLQAAFLGPGIAPADGEVTITWDVGVAGVMCTVEGDSHYGPAGFSTLAPDLSGYGAVAIAGVTEALDLRLCCSTPESVTTICGDSLTVFQATTVDVFELYWDDFGSETDLTDDTLRLQWTTSPMVQAMDTTCTVDWDGAAGAASYSVVGDMQNTAVPMATEAGAGSYSISCDGPGTNNLATHAGNGTDMFDTRLFVGDADDDTYDASDIDDAIAIVGRLAITQNPATLGALRFVTGDVDLTNDVGSLAPGLTKLERVGGRLYINNSGIVNINGSHLAALETVRRSVTVSNNDSLQTVVQNALLVVGEDMVVSGNDVLQTVTFGALTDVGGDVDISSNGVALQTVRLGAQLSGIGTFSIGGFLNISDNAWDALNDVDLDFSDLDSVGGAFSVLSNAGLNNWQFDDLVSVGTAFQAFTIIGNLNLACTGPEPSAQDLYCQLSPLPDENIGNNGAGCVAMAWTPTCP